MANEKRLIDAEQAKRATYEEIFWTESEQAVVRNFLAKLPKVDAVPIVHGRWIKGGDANVDNVKGRILHCSECGDYCYNFDPNPPHNYCPNCGADMRGETE